MHLVQLLFNYTCVVVIRSTGALNCFTIIASQQIKPYPRVITEPYPRVIIEWTGRWHMQKKKVSMLFIFAWHSANKVVWLLKIWYNAHVVLYISVININNLSVGIKAQKGLFFIFAMSSISILDEFYMFSLNFVCLEMSWRQANQTSTFTVIEIRLK